MTNVNFPVGDFLISFKNSVLARKSTMSCQNTKLIKSVAEALKEAGYITSVAEGDDNTLDIRIAYKSKKPLLMGLKIVSKPGLRIYKGAEEIKKIKGPSMFVVSTPKGILLSKKAIKLGVGGEVVAEVW